MNVERRTARRATAHLFCNQYIDGTPFLGEALELSMSGALVRRVMGPEVERACYALELGLAGDAERRVMLVASPVWRVGAYEAVKFVAQSLGDRLKLASLIGALGPVAA
jgi:hypothetical protein